MSKQTYRVRFCFSRRFGLSNTVAEAPKDIKDLFRTYSESNGAIMTVDQLHRFLMEFQGEAEATREDVESIIDGLSESLQEGLHFEAFFKYLFSNKNLPISPKLGVHHDMSAPLSHYFVYMGHNSYLTGNQLSSVCSDVPIINALKRGIRGIELDIWPNSTNDNVSVLHGGTLTAPVEFIKCLRSIKDHAFTASNYPLIITLEDHLKPNLQSKVASGSVLHHNINSYISMLTETFGDVLYYPGLNTLREFPSAESEYLETQDIKGKETNPTKVKDSTDNEASQKEVPKVKISPADLGKSVLDEDNDKEGGFDDRDKAPQNVPPEYKHLIAIRAGKPEGGLDNFLWVESDRVRFTQWNLLRVYPSGICVDSSNYNPFIGWMHGAQMVAFNMQGHGKYLWLMQGTFRANGTCGYVKKPDFLLRLGPKDEIFDPKAVLPVKTILKVTAYMGEGWYRDFQHTHFDLYSPPNFYVRVGIPGFPADSVMKKTKMLEDNWTPAWNEEFEFPLTVPELALLRIEVYEYDVSEKNDFGGADMLTRGRTPERDPSSATP
ncbi:hypothetical protein CDL15_Pgr022535 [Punica granatum]|uniref:Phosphoinositide phospholipase C n=1 Tax=Punica granatum TaxID=22663 RepID=A0A218XR66_PUNGR|nr:hypothetical protein CDL15_Pgr022535 [Punica granatum]